MLPIKRTSLGHVPVLDKPGAAAVQYNKLMLSEIHCLYEKIQQFDDNNKPKKQTKHTNASNTKRNKVKRHMILSLH